MNVAKLTWQWAEAETTVLNVCFQTLEDRDKVKLRTGLAKWQEKPWKMLGPCERHRAGQQSLPTVHRVRIKDHKQKVEGL